MRTSPQDGTLVEIATIAVVNTSSKIKRAIVFDRPPSVKWFKRGIKITALGIPCFTYEHLCIAICDEKPQIKNVRLWLQRPKNIHINAFDWDAKWTVTSWNGIVMWSPVKIKVEEKQVQKDIVDCEANAPCPLGPLVFFTLNVPPKSRIVVEFWTKSAKEVFGGAETVIV